LCVVFVLKYVSNKRVELIDFGVQNNETYLTGNKRAQRALGRSPEEKVKGHSGAIYRGPLMLSTKYW